MTSEDHFCKNLFCCHFRFLGMRCILILEETNVSMILIIVCCLGYAGTSSNWLTNWEAGFRDPFSGVRPSNNSGQPGTQSGRPKKVVRINIE